MNSSIGYFTLKAVMNAVNDKGVRVKNKTDMSFVKCGEDNFNYPDQDEVKLYGINNFYCIASDDYYLQGNFYRKELHYLELKLWKCQNTSTNSNCLPQAAIDSWFDK
jgi:hypothetical protein